MRSPAPPRVVVSGVSGSGKSTVGELLAARQHVPYADADDFHTPASIAKMSAGIPLDDEDRGPWLAAIGNWLADHQATGAVVTCSALKRSYRDALRRRAGDIWFLHLDGDRDVIDKRVANRSGHFMPASLVDSQIAELEQPHHDEQAIVVDFALSPDHIVDRFVRALDDRRT